MDLRIMPWMISLGIIVETLSFGLYWRKKKALSQSTLDPAKMSLWYLEHGMQLHREAHHQLNSESNPNKVIVFQRQCNYIVEHLGMAIESNQKSYNRSLSPEHKRECLGALKLAYQLAKEVRSFVWECCNEKTWMQVALTPEIVPKRVSLLALRLKVCTELLCHSHKLEVAWLTIFQDGSLVEEELPAIKQMALDDTWDLVKLLESIFDEINDSESNVSIYNKELVHTLLRRLRRSHDMPALGSLQSWKVDLEALLLKEHIVRREGLGEVYEGTLFGMIKIEIKELEELGEDNTLTSMRCIAHSLKHPNIISFLGFMDNEQLQSMIWEPMDGDLKTLMDRRMQEDGSCEGPFSIWEACDIMLQVAQGVRHMHQNRVLHRNFRSYSILVRSLKDERLEYIYAKVSGLDISKKIERSITNLVQAKHYGATRWRAPESGSRSEITTYDIEDRLEHVFKSDVYSFAITFFEILTGEVPFSSIESQRMVRWKVLEGVRPTLPEKTPQSLANLIKLCWDPDLSIRPSFGEICQELEYIRCCLLLEPQDHTPQLPLPVVEPLRLPPHVSKYKGEYTSLKVVRKLGSGGSDMVTVYLSMWLETGTGVAQKHFMGSHNECFINEVTIMAELLDHPNLVRLLRYASDRRSCSIAMELMDEDLHDLMHRRRLGGELTPTGPFSVADAVHVILEIARGMEYVHGKYVVHRDLKSCNILIRKASEGGRLEVKVADFGLSKNLASRHTLLGKEESGVGTIRWMAPEVISVPASDSSLTHYDPFESDVFSFGMLCYEVLVGRVPFYAVENLDTVRKDVLDGGRPTLPEWTPSYLKELIEKCWVKEPSERPTFTDIVGKLTKVRV